jgi:ligand-binding sensor domain-containing protein
MERRAVCATAILLAWCPCVFALDPSLDINQYAHNAWTVREGFFNGILFSIAQTPDGYLWLGTEFGLLRFDGVRAVPWQPPGAGVSLARLFEACSLVGMGVFGLAPIKDLQVIRTAS